MGGQSLPPHPQSLRWTPEVTHKTQKPEQGPAVGLILPHKHDSARVAGPALGETVGELPNGESHDLLPPP